MESVDDSIASRSGVLEEGNCRLKRENQESQMTLISEIRFHGWS